MGSTVSPESRPLDGNHSVGRSRSRKPLIVAILWGNILLAAWVIAGIFLYMVPAVDQSERADAVVVLAPILQTGRLEHALGIMSESPGTTLVVSVPKHASDKGSDEICRARRSYQIICFSPEPVTTQGEARAIQRLSEEHGWRSVTVVTNEFHVTRARTIIERCYPHQLNMDPVRRDRSFNGWVYRFVYESAAFVKAAVRYEC